MRVSLTVNGRRMTADDVWEGESLLFVLRERLALAGAKNACEQGECGSCTVRLDGVPVCACLVAVGQAEGRAVVTVEGLAARATRDASEPTGTGPSGASPTGAGPSGAGPTGAGPTGSAPGHPASAPGHPGVGPGPELAPVQRAFLDAGAVQCGFCTPGLLVAADELLERSTDPSDADIREALAGNLCRCTGYQTIVDAVRLAARRTRATGGGPARPADLPTRREG